MIDKLNESNLFVAWAASGRLRFRPSFIQLRWFRLLYTSFNTLFSFVIEFIVCAGTLTFH